MFVTGRRTSLCTAAWVAALLSPISAMAQESVDVPTPSNYGGVGLLDTRTARVFPDGYLALTASWTAPDDRYALTFQALPWAEVTFRYSIVHEQALYDRPLTPAQPLVHHSDRGVQYLSIRYTERLAQAGIEPSVGSTGDSYDNALAETVIGLFKTEEIYRRGPWKGLEDVEFATLEWVAWYNGSRLLEPLGYVSPAEFEKAYYDRQAAPVGMAVLT